jgi:hypothetical protein
MIAHCVYANTVTVMQYQPTIGVDNASSLRDLAGTDVS